MGAYTYCSGSNFYSMKSCESTARLYPHNEVNCLPWLVGILKFIIYMYPFIVYPQQYLFF